MNYAQARPLIKSGDALFWSHYDWSTWYDIQVQAVRLGTQSEYCHAAVAWEYAGRVWCIEAVSPLIRLVPLSNLIGTHGFYWAPLDVPMTNEELEFALAKVSIGKYSKVEAVRAQFEQLNNQDDDSWQCAEFLIACRARSGLNLGPKATPAAAVRKVQELGKPVYMVLPNEVTQ